MTARQLVAAALGLLFCGCDRGAAPERAAASPFPAPAAARFIPATNMVLIPAGTFTRGGFKVTLTNEYWLGKYEVTQGEFAALMGVNPSHFTGDPNRPVEKVTHTQAAAYCAALTKREREAGRLPASFEYRLPTEAEWEHACRAGGTNHYTFGADPELGPAHAWTIENSGQTTHPVGQKKPNAWGLHDIHGNVWEWTANWFGEYPAADVANPVGLSQGKFKVFRGGGWNQEIEFARCGNRFMMEPTRGIHFVGFRVALARK